MFRLVHCFGGLSARCFFRFRSMTVVAFYPVSAARSRSRMVSPLSGSTSTDSYCGCAGLLTKDEIDQMFSDKDNHLYASSRAAGKLYVFTITPTSHSQAKGSPYRRGC